MINIINIISFLTQGYSIEDLAIMWSIESNMVHDIIAESGADYDAYASHRAETNIVSAINDAETKQIRSENQGKLLISQLYGKDRMAIYGLLDDSISPEQISFDLGYNLKLVKSIKESLG